MGQGVFGCRKRVGPSEHVVGHENVVVKGVHVGGTNGG